MSHVVMIQTRLHDSAGVTAACRRLGVANPTQGTTSLFEGEATGLIVHLPGWQYPLVINTTSGEVRYDNFSGHWGDEAQLHRFLQAYAIEKVRLESRKKGLAVTEHQLQDGSVRLQIQEDS